MKTFVIDHIDWDYGSWSGSFDMEFPDKESASKWCAENSGGGESYYISREVIKA